METKSNNIIKISHIGIAVHDLDTAIGLFEVLGFRKKNKESTEEPSQGVRFMMMEQSGITLELLEPLVKGEPSPIDSYLKTSQYKMYHIAYVVKDFDAQIEYLEKQKYIKVGEPVISGESGKKRTVFMFNRKMGVIELMED